MRSWGYHGGHFMRILTAWAAHFFFWGLICQGMWWKLRGAHPQR